MDTRSSEALIQRASRRDTYVQAVKAISAELASQLNADGYTATTNFNGVLVTVVRDGIEAKATLSVSYTHNSSYAFDPTGLKVRLERQRGKAAAYCIKGYDWSKLNLPKIVAATKKEIEDTLALKAKQSKDAASKAELSSLAHQEVPVTPKAHRVFTRTRQPDGTYTVRLDLTNVSLGVTKLLAEIAENEASKL